MTTEKEGTVDAQKCPVLPSQMKKGTDLLPAPNPPLKRLKTRLDKRGRRIIHQNYQNYLYLAMVFNKPRNQMIAKVGMSVRPAFRSMQYDNHKKGQFVSKLFIAQLPKGEKPSRWKPNPFSDRAILSEFLKEHPENEPFHNYEWFLSQGFSRDFLNWSKHQYNLRWFRFKRNDGTLLGRRRIEAFLTGISNGVGKEWYRSKHHIK